MFGVEVRWNRTGQPPSAVRQDASRVVLQDGSVIKERHDASVTYDTIITVTLEETTMIKVVGPAHPSAAHIVRHLKG